MTFNHNAFNQRISKKHSFLQIFLMVLGLLVISNALIYELGMFQETFGFEEGATKDKNLLRLHIKANSDDSADQKVKERVRNYVVAYLSYDSAAAKSREELISYLHEEKSKLESDLQRFLNEQNINQQVDVNLETQDFPTRRYRSRVVQGGEYKSLVITLENGQGSNWWCVLFPPLCYVDLAVAGEQGMDENEKEITEQMVTNEKAEKDVSAESHTRPEIKFLTLEWLAELLF